MMPGSPECASHRRIELSMGRESQFICECGRWARVRFGKKGAFTAIETGEDFYSDHTPLAFSGGLDG